MKGIQLFRNMWMLTAVALTAVGCEKEDAAAGGSASVSKAARAAFEMRYPGASQVRWEVKGEYAVAEFAWNGTRAAEAGCAAWFVNADGMWTMTESDIRFDELPEAVRRTFASGEYASWRVDDIDMLERNGVEVIYVIEVEQNGTEMDLYYTADGVLVKCVADSDDDYGDFIPSVPSGSIENYIASRYPGARIIDVDAEYEGTEVELVDADRVKRELFFDRAENWLYTRTELRRTELPATVVSAWEVSDYSEAKGYRLDDAEFVETPDGAWYALELENDRDHELTLRISSDGTLLGR